MRRIPIPLHPEPWAALEVEIPLSPESWDHLLRVLDAMRLGIVAEHGDEVAAEWRDYDQT